MDTQINDLVDQAIEFWKNDEPLPLDLMVALEEAGVLIEELHRRFVAA